MKRLLSLFLALVMLVCLVPPRAVMAAGTNEATTEDQVVSAAGDTADDTYVMTIDAGATATDGKTLYTWLTDTLGWKTYKDFYAVNDSGSITFTSKAGEDWSGYYVSGNADVSIPVGTYEIRKFDRSGSFGRYKYTEASAGYITITAAAAEAKVELNTEMEVLVNGYYGPKDEGLAQRIYDAVVNSTNHDGAWKVTVYDGGTLSGWRALDSAVLTTSNFAPGQEKQVRITWTATANFPAKTVEVSGVKLVESRVAPTIAFDATKIGTYNTKADFEAAVKAALTVTDSNGAVITPTVEVTFGGYTFPGQASFTAKVTNSGASWIAGGEKSFTAIGAIKKYTVTWDANGGTFSNGATTTTTVVYGATPEAPETPTLMGQTFVGWNPEISSVTGNVTYTAVWGDDKNTNGVDDKNETATIQVNITGNGSVTLSGGIITDNGDGTYTVIYDSTVEGGNVITVTATPADTVNTDGSVDYLISAPATVTVANGETATVTAEFGTETVAVAESGTVYVNANPTGGEKLNDLKNKVLTAAGIDLADAANYTVYMVVGKLIGDGVDHIDVDTTSTADRANMYSRFNVGDTQQFVVQKNNGAVEVSDTISIKVLDSRLILGITASQETIEFSGKTEIEGILETVKNLFAITATDPETGAVTNVAVSDSYITWSPAYEWPADGNTSVFTVTLKVNSAANATYQNAPSASVTVTLKDTTKLYAVVYRTGYGEHETIASYVIAENLAMQTPADPTRKYYTFTGWTPAVAETVTGNMTYDATWTPDLDDNNNGIADQEETYKVVYYHGDSITTYDDLTWGEETPLFTPTWDGYNFQGWTPAVAETVTAPESGNTITYTAVWTKNHVVTFNDRGNLTYVEIEDGNPVARPNDPAWDENHDFLGWYNGDVKYDFSEAVTESLTLTAKWIDDFNHNKVDDSTEPHYTVTYNNDGTLTTFENILVGMPTPMVADPTKVDHKFMGWTPAVATTVTADVTYVAQWLNDVNNNGVVDTEETITITVNTAVEGDTVSITGATSTDAGYVFDSTKGNTITITANPVVAADGTGSYVAAIFVNGEKQALTYDDYSVTCTVDVENGDEIAVEFAKAEFVFNDDRLLNFYPGMPGIDLDAVYNTIVKTPALPGTYTLQYFARPATSQKVNLLNLVGDNEILAAALKAIGYETITIELDALWLTVEVNDLSDEIQNAVSLDQACAENLTKEKLEGLIDIYNNNGGLFGGGIAAVRAEIDAIIAAIKNAAMYYGAHSFGYNATDAETVEETIKVTFGNEKFYIEGETTITLKDIRLPSYLMGNNVSVMYRDFTDADLWALIAPFVQNGEGVVIDGALIYCPDITDPYTFMDKVVSDTAYELTFKFAGNDTYKPCEGTFTITVTKAPASVDIPDVNINYGEKYEMLKPEYVTLGNKYGDPAELIESMIQFVIGIDIADLDINGDGITGLSTKLQLILPEELQTLLDAAIGITGGNTSDGVEMNLSELTKYLEALPDDSLGALTQALKAIASITEAGNLTVVLGGALPTDAGAYLYGAVSTSSNYETAFDVSYIVIKPTVKEAYLQWNNAFKVDIFAWSELEGFDFGATVFDDEALTVVNKDLTDKLMNVIFGLDEEGNVVAELEFHGELPELKAGAYAQIAVLAAAGNHLSYAVPLARAFVILPELKIDIVDKNDHGKTNLTYVYNGKAPELDINIIVMDANIPSAILGEVTFTFYNENGDIIDAPVNPGTYRVVAVYTVRDLDGNIVEKGYAKETLVILQAVAEVGGVNYATLQDAIDAAKPGDTIKLLDDCTIELNGETYSERTITLPEGVTLDLNGKTLTIPFQKALFAGENITIKNGTITTGALENYVLYIMGGSFTIENVTCTNGINVQAGEVTLKDVTATNPNKYYAVYAGADAEVTILSGTYKTVRNDKVLYADGTITVYGGTYNHEPNESYLAENYIAEQTADGKYVVVFNAVATVNGTEYATLQDAIKAAKAGDTITLLKDCTIELSGETYSERTITLPDGVTLDLNGKTLTIPFQKALFAGENITIKNGTITTGGLENYVLYIMGGSFTVENVTCTNGINVQAGTVTMDNCTVTNPNKYYAVYAGANAEVTILSGTYKTVRNAKNLYADGKITVYGGTFNKIPNAFVAENEDLHVVKSGSWYTVYEGFQAALDAAEAGDTVILLADIDATEQIVINKSITLDLGVYTITGNTDEAVVRIYSAEADTTIDVTINATTGGIVNEGTGYAIYAGEDLAGGTDAERTNLTINGGNYETAGTDCIKQIMGLCTINGGSYKSSYGRTVLNGQRWLGSEFAINGGTFYEFNPACVSVWTGFDGKNYDNFYHQHDIIAAGKTATYADGWYTVVDGEYTPVAEVKSMCYPSLEAALNVSINLNDIDNLGVITLLANDTLDLDGATITLPEGLVIDLNGKTLTIPFQQAMFAGENITIKNGTITTGSTENYVLYIMGGSFTLENVTTTNGINVQAGEVTLKDVTATNPNKYYAVYAGANAEVTILSGNYKTVRNDKVLYADGTITVYGGIYNHKPNESYLADLYIAKQKVDGTYEVVEGTPVVQNATTGKVYASLWKAVNDAKPGETIQLIDDIALQDEDAYGKVYHMPDNSTLDLNGKTLTIRYARAMFAGKNITICNGTITPPTDTNTDYALFIGNAVKETDARIETSVTVKNVEIVNGGINVRYDAQLTIENTTVTVNPNRKYYAVYAEVGSTVNIMSGTYTGGRNKIDVLAADTATVTIYGGTYTNEPNESYLAKNYIAEKTADGKYIVVFVFNAVAKVNGTEYETLQDAINAAKAGDTITLLENCAIDNGGYTDKNYAEATVTLRAGVTLDLNGYTLTVPFQKTLFAGENITIKNGTITTGALENYGLYIMGGSFTLVDLVCANGVNVQAGTVTMDNCKVTNPNKYYAVYAGANAEVTILSGTYKTVRNAKNLYADGKITVYGGTFSKNPSAFVAEGYVVVENKGTYTVKFDEVVNAVAVIGNKRYETLAEAIEAAQPGDIIVLQKDIEITEVTTFTMKNGVTLNLNGKTVKAKDGKAIFVGASFTIKNGTFEAIGTKDYYLLTIDSGSSKALRAASNIVLEGLTVTGGGVKIRGGATVTLKNNTITANQSQFKYAVWAYGSANVTIESGTYIGGKNGYDVFAEGKAKINVCGGNYKFAITERYLTSDELELGKVDKDDEYLTVKNKED